VPGWVLVSGGTGVLGGLVAGHLAVTGRARGLVLVSRSGPGAVGVAGLVAGLAGSGAGVRVVACDVADRGAVGAVVAGVRAVGRLSGVVHAAGVVDDGLVGSLTAERVAAVMRPKADAGWCLHEATEGLDLDAFVLFSSAAAVFGGAGQGSYVAGNAFLDGLAAWRRAAGLPGVSLAWGAWVHRAGIGRHLGAGQLARISRSGMAELSAGEGLALLDLALGRDEAVLVPARLDVAGLRAQAARGGDVPPLWRSLASRHPSGGQARPSAISAADGTGASAAESLRRRLAGLSGADQDRVLMDLVRTQVAAVLGHSSPEAIEPGRAFTDLGFDSLTAVELRNRLHAATGLRLPATVIFDYPSPAVLTAQLRAELAGDVLAVAPQAPVLVAAGEPIAIVAMGCRFPGGVRDPEGLWELLAAGGDAISGFPQDRGWDLEGVFDPDPDHAGTSYVRAGGFLHDVADFDAGFFGISPREALAMDPQQRLLLETSWEALERAGIDPAALRGSPTGVFVGAAYSGYGTDLPGLEGHLLTGTASSVMSGRVSYLLGLEGPAVTVDTACSSSLVALHLACQSLRAGECSLALVGGVTVLATPGGFVGFSRQRGLAADGRCKSYSAAADGMSMAEGAGMLVLEPLSAARDHGHQVLAVIRGSAINQDGASNGLTAPNGPSQQRVIRAALASAGLSADQVDAVEGHGTGTPLGDPIEVQALMGAYGQDRPQDRPLWLGSVKSNIGHAQQAAGVAGVMKIVLALQHQLLPATLHAGQPSSHVDWSSDAIRLVTEAVSWPEGARPRRAGVSSFGFSGTNAHTILEEAPADARVRDRVRPPLRTEVVPWLVSGRTAAGLAAQAGRLAEWVRARPELDPADVGWSLAATRSAFEHRAVVTGASREELAAGLAAVAAAAGPAAGVVTGAVRSGGVPRVGFVFAGQGSQRAGMGAELHAASPVFAAAFDQACGLLEAELGVPVADVVLGRGGRDQADQTLFAQPGLFAVEAGLVALLASCGITPDAVAGHSVGEVAAAYAAGVLSLADACALVATRARLMQALPGGGAMCAIAATEAEITALLADVAGVSIAAVNGPSSVVVSGDAEAVEQVAEVCRDRGRRVKELRVSHAFHSHRMEPVLAELGEVAAGLEYALPRVPWAGALSGELVAAPEPGYWVRQAREPVRFADAVAALAARGISVFIEIGPDGTLSAMGPAALADDHPDSVFIPVLRPGQPGPAAIITALARAHVQGAAVDWAATLGGGQPVDLPTYAFRHKRYWPQPGPALVTGGDGAETAGEARFWAAVEGGQWQALSQTLAVDDRQLSEVLPVLASWRRRERNQSMTADWWYRATWVPVADPGPRALSGTWLVVRREQGDEELADRCVRGLTAAGAESVLVGAGPAADRAALAARISGALAARNPDSDGAAGVPGVAGVVSLLALDESLVAGSAVLTGGLAGTLALVQALGDAGVAAPLWVLTCGAVAAGTDEELVSPLQATVWGLGRTAGLELTERWGGLIDVPARWDERTADRLCEVLGGCGEDQVAIRPGAVMARRLTRAPLPHDDRGRWVPRGTVLVTGDTEALGGQVARWLAGRAAPRVVLASAAGPAAAGAPGLAAAMAGQGTTVDVVACELAERAQLAGLVAWLAAAEPRPTAVVHAAGPGQATAVQEMTVTGLAGVMAARAGGAAHLHELTAGLNLERFVLFSSAAATWGSAGLAGYAAANAYLDALAESRRGQGQPAVSVAWGPLGGIAGEGDEAHWQRRGLRLMDPWLAAQALEQLLDRGGPSATVADVDWARFAAAFTLRRPSPLIADLPEVKQALAAGSGPGGVAAGEARPELARRLAGLSRGDQVRVLTDLVKTEAAAVLGHSSPAALEEGRAFRDLGFDSLTAVELRDRLNSVTGLILPATLVFDYPTPLAAAEFVRAGLAGEWDEGAQAPVVVAAPGEPIAIVSMACRFPGGVGTPEEFWELLASGGDAISGFPDDRGWDVDSLYDPDPDHAGTTYTRAGGFVYDSPEFDAGFFGISPREALAMDPQQRVLLEVCWETIERAGIDPGSLHGSRTGVFAGAVATGYGMGLELGEAAGHLMTGTAGSVISGRVSYTLGLEGPAVTVDTACSSSLVALHLACQALRSGECDLALAGGVTMLATPEIFVGFSQQQGLAPDGRCKAFSAAADGTGWAEGAGMVLVERLSDARRHGHQVLAVVTGSSVNQDGASNGLTAPNGPSQQRVIRAALASARLTPDEIDAVEAHGTGTRLGDPIEAQALLATYGQGRPAERPLWLGSVKSNIGHAQAAAGVAGLIKMVLALQHQQLPPTLHAQEPSPHVNWSAGAIRLLTEGVPWPAGGSPRRAAISAFGMSGTNAHAILEEPPAAGHADGGEPDGGEPGGGESDARPPVLTSGSLAWLVSARTAEGLAAQAARLAAYVAARPELDPADVGWSLATSRAVFEHRAVILGTTGAELAAVAAGQTSAGLVTGTVRGGVPRVGFMFAGQGSQRAGMGAELHAASPVFAAAFDQACALLEAELGVPVADVVLGRGAGGGPPDPDAAGQADQTLFAQPGLFAVEAGLVALLAACGITPDAVAGHSVGEVAAAYAAGVLSLEDACALVAARARLMQALPGGGAMCAIAATEAEITAALADTAWVSVAAVNGPSSVVISGDADAVAAIAEDFRAQGRRVKPLRVSHAFHSHRMEPILSELGEVAARLDYQAPTVPWAGALSGELVAVPEAGYWTAQARQPVRFADAVAALAAQGVSVFIEIGPDGTLSALGPAALPADDDAVFIPALRPGQPAPVALLDALARAHVHGATVNWAAVLDAGQRVDLPTYAFQRQRFWPQPSAAGAGDVTAAGLAAVGHPLLGAAVAQAGGPGYLFTGQLSVRTQPWLADHAVGGVVLLPGTAFVEMAVLAGDPGGCGRVAELMLEAPLILPTAAAVRVQVVVGGLDAAGDRTVEVWSQAAEGAADAPWTRHASGRLSPAEAGTAEDSAAEGFAVWPPDGAKRLATESWYAELAAGGYGYGPSFQGLRAAWQLGADVFAEVALPDEAAECAGSFGIHPALLDAALHAGGLADAAGDDGSGGIRLPFAWTGVSLHASGASALRVRLRRTAADRLSLTAADSTGALVVSVDSLVLRSVARNQLEAPRDQLADALFAVTWVPVPAGAPVAGRCAVVGPDRLGLAAALVLAGVEVRTYDQLAQLAEAAAAGEPAPQAVLACAGDAAAEVTADPGDTAQAARRAAGHTLALVQEWLAMDSLEPAQLVVVTRAAIAAGPGEGIADLAGAAAWGLLRAAQSENPDRLVLADLATAEQAGLLAAALGSGEPELAIRNQAVYGRRLTRPAPGLVRPAGTEPWRLDITQRGTLDGLNLTACPEAAAPLGDGQVRIAVRAAGLNFRDVLIGLGVYPGQAVMGTEIAGLVTETGPQVTGLTAGDRVLGLTEGGFGPVVVTDARLLARLPDSWSFARGASVPVAFGTAWYALTDLAAAQPGQKLLVHAAAGGVGMAAVTIARHLGLEVYGTASPGKHAIVAARGLDAAHTASSRTSEFEPQFLAATGGDGMDIVLNALAGELTDASLRLLPRGGAFVEMGKTDPRDPEQIAREHPGVAYRAFGLADAGPDRLGEILAHVMELLAAGDLAPLPVQAWDVRRAREAFRYMSQARHTGKLVLMIPPDPAAPRTAGTVLVTGGTGMLGGLVAGHLADTGRARGVVLASRSGPAAAGVAALAAGLAGRGAAVQVAACDAADRPALASLLAALPAGEPLTGVVHTAGLLDDGVIGSLTPARIDAVMRPKADAAWNLHQLTRETDLDMFVMFSSAAATFGGAGQANYAAANTFMDGLAARRKVAGLPATSLAWGLWADASGITGHLSEGDLARLTRGGMTALSATDGLGLLDLGVSRDEAHLVPVRLDLAGLRAQASQGAVLPPLWRSLAGSTARPAATAAGPGAEPDALRQQLAGLPGAEQDRILLDLVRGHVAAVLGHGSPDAVEPGRVFSEIGFDSLTAVELRNRLNAATGLRLPATLVFDYPSPVALVEQLRTELAGTELAVSAAPPRPSTSPVTGDPVAIVSMGCRFPGEVNDPAGLWELLAGRGDAISGLPRDRGWDLEALFNPDPDHAGTSYVRAGGFVAAADFDAEFFGISPREALAMDPQQRLVLEVCWEALELAGIAPGTLQGSQAGVFVGAAASGYGGGLPGLEGHLLTGTASSVLSGRVSYLLGLEGPAVTVDTACSSSLVALHLACQSLRAGECDLALAGGVMVIVTPGGFVGFSQQRGLAADGRSKAFSAAADGMGMAEGAGMVVLERLSDARRRGHRVLAVVAGSAINQDGASNGLTAPNGPSQQRVIRAALASAGLRADEIDVVEAHGTGTRLGDPIEAQALLATYGQDRPQDRPLWLGSVKSNIGHTQAAAGIAGVMKIVLALQHGVLPATLHAEQPSSHVDWSSGAVRLAAEEVSWPGGERLRRAGVSSFGFSGTNAHMILAEGPAGAGVAGEVLAPTQAPAVPPLVGAEVVPWLVSGRTAAGLAAQAGRLAEWVRVRPALAAGDVGWSLAATRSVFEHRAVITGGNDEQLAAGLAAVAAGQSGPGVVTGAVRSGAVPRVGFVFAGQGAQRAGMGAELHAASPVFAAAFDRACALLEAELGVDVAEVVLGRSADGGPLDPDVADQADQTLYAQPGLFAVEVGLVALLAACGITPDAVAGHSVGEVAAAYAAGVLSLEDACTLVAARARLMQALPAGGAMTAIAGTEAEIIAALDGTAGVSIAAVNGPSSVVISGDADAVAEIAEDFRARGRRVKPLRVSHAFHSHRMDPVLAELAAVAARLQYQVPRVPWAGAVSGEVVAAPEPGYWVRQAREPVRFADAVAALAAQGVSVFIEIGPDGTLSALGPAALADDADTVFIPVLRPGSPAPRTVTTALARAHVRGVAVNWTALLGGGQQVDLPTHAFQRRRYWPQPVPAQAAGDITAAGLGAMEHPLLGAAVELAGSEGYLLTGRLSVPSQPWLADHVVAGRILLPGTAFVEMAVRAGDLAGCGRIAELVIEAPLVLPGDGAVRVQVIVGGQGDGGQRTIEVYGGPGDAGGEGPWTRHARGLLAPPGPAADRGEFTVWPPDLAVRLPMADLSAFAAGHGPAFQGLRAAWRCGEDVLAEVALPDDTAVTAGSFGLHPALLDTALQAAALVADPAAGPRDGAVQLPSAWTGVSLYATGASALRVRLRRDASGGVSLLACDGAGDPVVSVASVAFRPVAAGQLTGPADGLKDALKDALFSAEWTPVPVSDAAGPRVVPGRWAVVGADVLGLVAGLTAAGADVGAHDDLAALAAAIEAGEPVPDLVLAAAGGAAVPAMTAGQAEAGEAAAARRAAGAVLELVQEWLGHEHLSSSRLMVVTRGAVPVLPGEGVSDLAGAAVWGLVRAVQAENPGRAILADLPAPDAAGEDVLTVLVAALETGEPEFAVRAASAYRRRLVRPAAGLVAPADAGPWRLEVAAPGTIDGLVLTPCPQAAAPLRAGQVRVAVRAAGVTIRDVQAVLDTVGDAELGGEIAGVVLETSPEVTHLAAGDRVLGLARGGFGPVAVTDARLLVPIPDGWTFAQAASVPAAFTTAWYALTELARARPGQRLLVHTAAGGVGMAAVAIARHLGLRVYATASPGKRRALTAFGLAGTHVSSSRTAEFEAEFLTATGGAGMDIVLNTLAGELAEASLRLLPRGGTFLELGRTDTAAAAAAQRTGLHPEVAFQAVDLRPAGPDVAGRLLTQVTGLLAAGKLAPLPIRTWDVRRAREAFRFMSEARHTGKIVLTIPPDPAAPAAAGTVLITGGTGMLGTLVAGHLAATGRARSLLLASRSGPAAPDVAALTASLSARGVRVQVTACDAADPAALAGLLAKVPAGDPLTAVVHTAGVIDDGVIESLTAARVDAVMRPKADAAWHLHQLTAGLDLRSFVLFSSAAATFGHAGQGSYVAANGFLDGLASYRRAAGRPAVSLAWGTWLAGAGIGRNLGDGQLARISRTGIAELSAQEGLALLDLAMDRDEALLVPARLDLAGLRAAAARGVSVPPLLTALTPVPSGAARPSAAAAGATGQPGAGSLPAQLAGRSAAEQDRILLDLVRTHVATVLDHASPEAIEPGRAFNDLGFDSLTSVELRNQLHAATGVRLAGTAAFDYPTSELLARQLHAELTAAGLLSDADSAQDGAAHDHGRRYVVSASAVTAAGQVPGQGAVPARFLGRLYLQAAQDGRAAEIMQLMGSLAAFRSSFTSAAGLENIPSPVSAARGPATPGMICFPSFAGRSGAQEYARLAAGFRGIRDVSVIPAPGFAAEEPLPATVEALISVHAENIRRSCDGAPFVLAGYSSGGLVAHALATHLQSAGSPPAAVVLIDTYTAEVFEKLWPLLPGRVLADDDQSGDAGEDAWLTATARYFSLGWSALDRTDLPTLLVRAREFDGEPPANTDWKPSWAFSSRLTVVDVPGEHFTMMNDHAGTTARAVNEWLAEL
jgi:candicidin polyketide synthase FscB